MKSSVRKMLNNHKTWLLVPILAVMYLLAAGVASAAQPAHLELLLPGEGKIGSDATVKAILTRDDSSPIEGMEVVFFTKAQFANVNGELEIGRSVTDNQGAASFIYSPRTMGEQSIIARFSGNDEYESIEISGKIIVQPGPQLQIEVSGINVPGVGVWIFALAVGVVWGIFFSIMVLLELIARRGANITHQGAEHE